MKISDFIFHYPSGYGPGRQGMCRVRIFVLAASRPVVLLTDLDTNIGPSVTNAVEFIIRALIRRGHATSIFRFIEHYERDAPRMATFDEVFILSNGAPSWTPLTFEQAVEILGCQDEELTCPTSRDPRLVEEIGRVKQTVDPRADLPHQPSSPTIQRMLDIEAGMVSKRELQRAVDSGAGERELQAIIHKDLSLLGEVYGLPQNEYICFPEFRIGDGAVDFAVFTGRSRMDVFLIEIKGADFNFMGTTGYRSFNSKINIAAEQIRERHRQIQNQGSVFPKELHKIRKQAESGGRQHNGFLSPIMPLEVDPNKDIVVHGVVIGGRLRDDHAESRKRHDFEETSAIKIKVDSWDSWLNRLRRDWDRPSDQ